MAFHKGLPYFTKGLVVKGFGRGSKQLGIPTANYPMDVVDKLPPEIEPGVYFGYAAVDAGPVHKMVMSVGWNPFYKNEKKSMETYLIHEFSDDFYEKILKVVILGYLRPEKNFSSVEELIIAIKTDIRNAEKTLEEPGFAAFKTHDFFSDNTDDK